MANKTILFVSHKKAKCGVYEFGKNVSDVLQHSTNFKFIRVECSSLAELQDAVKQNNPSAIIYNYYPSVMPWIATRLTKGLFKNHITSINIPQIGIVHEITREVADTATNYQNKFVFGKSRKLFNSLFDYYIAPDPTLLLQNPFVFKTGRLVPAYENKFSVSSKPTFGSFGFGTGDKGFE